MKDPKFKLNIFAVALIFALSAYAGILLGDLLIECYEYFFGGGD